MYDTATLIKQTFGSDEYGNQIARNIETEVFVLVESISRAEFYNAGQEGLKPEYKLVVWSAEYSDEKLIRYNDELYSIYRNYKNGDKTELFLEKKVGV